MERERMKRERGSAKSSRWLGKTVVVSGVGRGGLLLVKREGDGTEGWLAGYILAGSWPQLNGACCCLCVSVSPIHTWKCTCAGERDTLS